MGAHTILLHNEELTMNLAKVCKLTVAGIVIIGGTFWGHSFYDRQFHLENITFHGLSPLETPQIVEQRAFLDKIIDQPFYYLDRGKQSFVFVSADDKYVLKFFDVKCSWSGGMLSSLSSEDCQKKLLRLIHGYRIADAYDRDYGGVLFTQIVPNPSLQLNVIVTDRFGFKHTIDLSSVPFVVQKKAVPTRTVLTALLINHDVSAACHKLRQIIDMYVEEHRRGLWDSDHNFMYNTGFIDDQPVRIDLGRLSLDEEKQNPQIFAREIKKIAFDRLEDWLERHFPLYSTQILADMHDKIDEVLSNSE
jgi:hypothetical protein